MRRTKITFLLIGATLATLAAQVALAQQAPNPSFKDLLGAGYEIKNVVYLPRDAFAPPSDLPNVLVTLQKGGAVAVCQFAAVNWDILNPGSLESTNQCDIYPTTFVR